MSEIEELLEEIGELADEYRQRVDAGELPDINLENENIEMAGQMLSIQMRAYAIANKEVKDGNE